MPGKQLQFNISFLVLAMLAAGILLGVSLRRWRWRSYVAAEDVGGKGAAGSPGDTRKKKKKKEKKKGGGKGQVRLRIREKMT